MENNSKAKECGQRLRRVRMAQNMSQQELADKMYTTPQNISKYEKDGIANIDIIMKLNEVLGYNLLVDEIDQEGVVGEIGREILSVIVENKGYIDVEDLIQKHMYGMDMQRVTAEIFKLQKIGLCVREQFVGYAGCKNDGLFITAKGIITLKNNSKVEADKLKEVSSFENIVLNVGIDTYQELLDSDKLEKLLWKLPLSTSYRANYIKYLKTTYQFSSNHYGKDYDFQKNINETYIKCISGENVYHDILHRMIAKLDNATLDLIYNSFFEDQGTYEYYEGVRERLILKYDPTYELHRKMDSIKLKTFQKFCNDSDWYAKYVEEKGMQQIIQENLDDEAYLNLDKKMFSPEDAKLAEEYDKYDDGTFDELKYNQASIEHFIFEVAKEKESPLITEWFSKKEIEDFINENMGPAKTDEEIEIDKILLEINKKFPETLDYYIFPEEWEENGIAALIRKNCNIPERTNK